MKTELKDGIKTTTAKSAKDWRKWLEKNGVKEKNVWLIIYKKASGVPSITYKQAVEEALCFGWIDSKPNKRDDKSYYQFFAQRNAKSKWSKINKNTIERLINEDKMHETGMAAVDIAKQNGMWNALDEIDNAIMPADFQNALNKNKQALKNFAAFPVSSRKIILGWIADAKRAETRSKRIKEAVTLAAKNIRANHYNGQRPAKKIISSRPATSGS